MALLQVAKFLLTIRGQSLGMTLEMIALVEAAILQSSTLKMRTMQPLHPLAAQQKKLTSVYSKHLLTQVSNGPMEALLITYFGGRESPTTMAIVEELRTVRDSSLTIKHGMIFTAMVLLGMIPT